MFLRALIREDFWKWESNGLSSYNVKTLTVGLATASGPSVIAAVPIADGRTGVTFGGVFYDQSVSR